MPSRGVLTDLQSTDMSLLRTFVSPLDQQRTDTFRRPDFNQSKYQDINFIRIFLLLYDP